MKLQCPGRGPIIVLHLIFRSLTTCSGLLMSALRYPKLNHHTISLWDINDTNLTALEKHWKTPQHQLFFFFLTIVWCGIHWKCPVARFAIRHTRFPQGDLGYFSWPRWRICPLLPGTNIVAVWLTVVPLSLTLLNQTPPTPGWRQLTVPASLLIWDWAQAYGWLEWSGLWQSTRTEIRIYNVCNIIKYKHFFFLFFFFKCFLWILISPPEYCPKLIKKGKQIRG